MITDNIEVQTQTQTQDQDQTVFESKVYCIRCGKKTENTDSKIQPRISYRLICKCAVCHKKKNRFLKQEKVVEVDTIETKSSSTSSPTNSDSEQQKDPIQQQSEK